MLSPLLLRRAALLALLATPTLASAVNVRAAASTTAPNQCKRLTDPTNKFVSALKMLFSALPPPSGSADGAMPSFGALADPAVFASLDAALPELSQCIGEVDPLSLIMGLMSSPTAQSCWQEVDALGVATSPGAVEANATYFEDSLCPVYKTSIVPCVADVLLPAVETAFSSTNGCCDPFQKQVDTHFGGSLTKTVNTLVQLVGNALCAVKSSSTDADALPVTCGDSLEANWLKHTQGEDAAAFLSMFTAFQIPNDQVCKAASSLPFTTTSGVQAQFGFDGVDPYGICYSTADALVTYVRSWPLWSAAIGGQSTYELTENLFGDKRCERGEDLVQWVVDEDGPVIKTARVVDELLASLGMAAPTEPTKTPTVTPSESPSSGDGSAATPEPTTTEPTTPEPTTPEPTTPEPTTPEPTTPEPTTPEPTTPEPTTPEPTTPEPTTPEPTTPEPTTPEPTTPEPTTPEPSTATPEPTTTQPTTGSSASGANELFDGGSASNSGSGNEEEGILVDILSNEIEPVLLTNHDGADEVLPKETDAPFVISTRSMMDSFQKILANRHNDGRLLQESSDPSLNLTTAIQTMASQLTTLVGNMCFHIPNGVQCSFSGQWLEEPFPQGAFDPAGNDDPTPTPTTTKPTSNAPTSETNSSNSTGGAARDGARGSTSMTVVAAAFAVMFAQLI